MDSISLTIQNKAGIVFSGPVSFVSSVNVSGKFDILNNHANFISLITEQIKYKEVEGGREHIIPLSTPSILKASGNKVDIYLGI